MQVIPTTFTVADYCKAMENGEIYPNREYQRSETVWPPAARSYLIDTILHGYPIPKLSLAQKTDLRTRKTVKEIVDGQQRSQAILDFYQGNFRLSTKSSFAGKRYEGLDEEEQHKFLDYALSIDLFVGATQADIRQVFRRINSYTVPLNPQEQRHARFQGPFKWFIVNLTELYAQPLIDIGVLKERQISRMADSQFFTEVAMCLLKGVTTYSKSKIDRFYEEYDDEFKDEEPLSHAFSQAFANIMRMTSLHSGSMMKPHMFFSLLVAVLHMQNRYDALNAVYDFGKRKNVNIARAESNLSLLGEALETAEPIDRFKSFVGASTEATNTAKHRTTRIKWCCKALDQERI